MIHSYSANVITTKIKSMYGKRITENDYAELIKKQSVSEVAAYLKHQTKYSAALLSIQESTAQREQLENLLNRDLFHRYLKLVHYDVNKQNSFFKYRIIGLDIQQILSTIRYINAGKTERIIETLPGFVRAYSKVNFMRLGAVKTIDDLISVLHSTPYAQIIRRVQSSEDGSIDITACEVALRTYYFQEIEKLIDEHYKGSLNHDLKMIFSTQIEINNVTTIYRLKMFFGASAKEIVKYIIPIYARIPKAKIMELLETKTAEEFLEMLTGSKYGKFFDKMDYQYVEYTTERVKYNINKKYMNFSNEAPICFAAYMTLCEIEIDNLTTIIEGVRYKVPAEKIEKLLIL